MLKHLSELQALKLPLGQYAIYGSGPLAVRNLRDSADIDIIVKNELWEKLARVYSQYLCEEPLAIHIGKIEIYSHWPSPANQIDEMIDSAEMIDGLPFVNLKYVILWKEAMGREKDKRDLTLIKQYLESHDQNRTL